MPGVMRRIVDLEWPTRYLLECGHAVAIAEGASVAEMAMPGQELACTVCGGEAPEPASWLSRFRAGEAINAMTLNARLEQVEARFAALGEPLALPRFAPDEPINAETLNRRLDLIAARLGA
ncbi:MAG TPA: hypothetical protein V6D47_21285 [Oscillatoriaceae cyanobacterium]